MAGPKPGPPRRRTVSAPGDDAPGKAVGPLGRVIGYDAKGIGEEDDRFDRGANALIMLHQVVFLDHTAAIDEQGVRALLRWASEQHLGQQPERVADVAVRRAHALAALEARGLTVVRLYAKPEWRLIVGANSHGNPNEIGITLHGTYGWPILPGSSLKGLTAAWASGSLRSGGPRADAETLERIFGAPRPRQPDETDSRRDRAQREEGEARRGSVRFLDALPADGPVQITVDVLTPHVQPYYGNPTVPPAEYHNPIPNEFLTVSGGTFAVDLVGPEADVRSAGDWCQEAFEELGLGAKTAAGYGYLTVERRP